MSSNHRLQFTVEPGKQEILVTRVFDAPRELVFRALTDPQAISQWWGPRDLTTTVDKMEARPGGVWRYCQRDAQGNEYDFHGVYHAVEAPTRIVQTFEFEGTPGHVVLETTVLEEQDGQTLLTNQSVFQSVADRDAMVQEGMEGGVIDSYERLAEVVAQHLAAVN